jgi:hypothetical protein
MSEYTCDRKGPPAKVIDESGDEPITCIYPACSVCGMPQVFLTVSQQRPRFGGVSF